MGEVSEEGVGGVEVGIVLDGVDGAEEEDEGEDYEGGLSGMEADRHVLRWSSVTTQTRLLNSP